ncbi:hypothetical protein EXN66_Car009131 [Channa argus]|uniref:Uncharacterized protein n=1 Tax=Channa argus TaxID=215402 RepID=A0A6G1PT57_CHAAH|nr:hypothetical protein EXN66_Car009131 [Channa argus]
MGRAQTRLRQLTVCSSLRHLASNRRRRENLGLTVPNPDGAIARSEWFSVGMPGTERPLWGLGKDTEDR